MKLPRARGVTLVELVVVIVILGILAGISALVLVPAFEAYFASGRRAEVSDMADSAIRRMVRDVRLALPNSARVDGTGQRLELLLTRTGGRYRSLNDDDLATSEQTLDFAASDAIFDAFEPFTAGQITLDNGPQVGDFVVVHNLGIPGADAYDFTAASPNIKRITGFSFSGSGGALANEDRFTLAAGTSPFPLESPGRRFFVIRGPVSFACVGIGTAGGNGTGSLRRWSGYTYEPPGGIGNTGAPPVAAPAGSSEAILAGHVSGCAFTYTNNIAQVSRGLVSIRLTLTRGGESTTLYHEVHVNNVP
jgi:MSHA biogenesis protein MshO